MNVQHTTLGIETDAQAARRHGNQTGEEESGKLPLKMQRDLYEARTEFQLRSQCESRDSQGGEDDLLT